MMITAAKNPVGGFLVWQLIRSAITKQFSAVHVREREPADPTLRTMPTIYYANHSSWWDGYMCTSLAEHVFRQDSYIFMEEKNLRRYRFFTWTGAFGVDRDNARSALQSLDYAAGLLTALPGRGVYIYPQGTMVPNDSRPFTFYSGLVHLARRVGRVRLVPVAIRYEFLQEQRPDAFMSIGPAYQYDAATAPRPRTLLPILNTTLTTELDILRADIAAERIADFRTIMRGSKGIDRLFDRAMSRGPRATPILEAEEIVQGLEPK